MRGIDDEDWLHLRSCRGVEAVHRCLDGGVPGKALQLCTLIVAVLSRQSYCWSGRSDYKGGQNRATER